MIIISTNTILFYLFVSQSTITSTNGGFQL